MSEPLDVFLRRLPIVAQNPYCADPEFAARDDFGLQLSFAKNNPFSDRQFPAGPHQRFPEIGGKLSRQKHFHSSCQVFPSSRSRWRLRMNSSSFAEEPRGNHSRVVKHQKLVASEKLRKLSEKGIGKLAGPPVEQQKP